MNEFELKQFVGTIINAESNAYHNRIKVVCEALWKLRSIDADKAVEMYHQVQEIGDAYGKLLSKIERQIITLGDDID